MLKQLANSLWVNEIPFNLLGVDFGNRMSCIKLNSGELCLHSPTKFDLATFDKISQLGEIKYVIAPSLMHNLFVMDWKNQANGANVIAPSKAKKVTADVMLDKISPEQLSEQLNHEIVIIPINGIPIIQEYAFIHLPSKTLILTDIAFNFGNDSHGWSKFIKTIYGVFNKFGPSISIRSLIKDKAAFHSSLRSILHYDFERIIVSHGNVIETDAKNKFEKAFSRYLSKVSL